MILTNILNRKFWFKKENWFAFVVLSFAVIYSFCLASPVLFGSEPYGVDNSYHFAITYNIVQGIGHGYNILDVWFPYWNGGHPTEQYYQHFPHVFTAFLYFLFFEKLPVLLIYKGVAVALLTFLPVSFFYGAYVLGFNKETASITGLMSLLISSNCSWGIDYCSYFGWGLFTQLFATFLLPICISSVYTTVKYGRYVSVSVLLLCLVFTSNIIFGFIAVLTAILFIFSLRGVKRWRMAKRIFSIFLFTVLVLSYWIIPMYMNESYYYTADLSEDFADSYGVNYFLSGFLNGSHFDYGRIPFFTVFVLVGLVCCMFSSVEQNRFLLLGFFVWSIMYIGKGDIWILELVPLSDHLPFFRFVNGFHFFAIMLASLGLFQVVRYGRKKAYGVITIILIFVLLFPMIFERVGTTQNYIKTFDDTSLGGNRTHFDDINQFLENSLDGRVFVGTKTGLGTHFLVALVPIYSGRDVLHGRSFSLFSPCYPFMSDFNGSIYDEYDMFNVRYILGSEYFSGPDFSQLIFESGPYKLFYVNTSGYFGFSDPWNNVMPVYGSDEFNECGEVISEDVGYNYYSAMINVSDDCDVVLKITSHPYWSAYVDDVEQVHFDMYPCFMGVDMSEGVHKVDFFYRTSILKSVLFVFGMFIIVVLILFDLKIIGRNILL